MSRGKHLSFEEARRAGKLDQFAKEHPSKGSWTLFDRLFAAMAGGDAEKAARIRRARRRTSSAEPSAD